MEFKVLTLNCWGIPMVSPHRKQRMRSIAQYLAASDYDAVCLQEVWSDKDYFLIKNKVSRVLPYSHYFYSGYNGSGVCIFSKHLIMQTFFHKWMINGYVHKVHHGDWFGGKGIGLCRVRCKDMNVNVYTTHLHAEYNRKNDEYLPCRVIQAYEAAQFISISSMDADLVILAADLNTEPGDLPFRMFMDIARLRDSYTFDPDDEASTYNAKRNTFTPDKVVKQMDAGPRIDYVLFSGGPKATAKLVKYQLPLPDQIPGKQCSYSDHEAVSAQIMVTKGAVKTEGTEEGQKRDLLEAIALLANAIKTACTAKCCYWFWTVLVFLLLLVSFVADPYVPAVAMGALRVLLTLLTAFTLVMATVWNRLELNAIYASKYSMEVHLQSLN